MAEHLPGSIQVFSRALGVNEAQLFKMMERGELLASEVLPKVAAEFRRTAREGGAYEEALKSLRTQKGRFVTESQRAADTIFKSGFEEGLAELYGELQNQLGETGKAQEDMGNIYKRFFQTMKVGLKVVVPLLESMVHVISKTTDLLAHAASGYKNMYSVLKPIPYALEAITVASLGLFAIWKPLAAKLLFALGTLQEIASLFDDKLVGALEKSMGSQFNFKTGMSTELVVTSDGEVFNPEDYAKNVMIDVKEIKNFEDMQKFLDLNKISLQQLAEQLGITQGELLKTLGKDGVTKEVREALQLLALKATGFAEKLEMPLEKWLEGLNNGTIAINEFSDAIKKVSQTEIPEWVQNTAKIAGYGAVIATLIAAFVKLRGGVKTLTEGFKKVKGFFDKKTPDLPKKRTVVNPKKPIQLKDPSKLSKATKTLKGVAPTVGKGLLTAVKSATVLAALEPTMMGDATYTPEQLKEMMSSGNGFGLTNSGSSILNDLNNIKQSPIQHHNKIEISGIEVHLSNASPQEAINASEVLFNSLADQLQAYNKVGR